MDELTKKIREYLLTNPNSSAREIGNEIGFSKNEVNSCLYANEGTCFSKEGLTPPLWMNIGESSETERAKTGLAASDEDESNEDFNVENEDQEEGWTRLDAEDQEEYLVIKTLISLGAKVSKEDRRRMNQLVNKIRNAERSETASVEKQEYRAKNRAKYAAEVNKKVNEIWSVDEQRQFAIEALSLQFESNLRKLAYGYLISRDGKLLEQETENEIEIRKAKGRDQVEAVSSSIDTRLSNLETVSDKDLISSAVGFAWINRGRTSSPQAKNTTEIFPQFEENDKVKIYRSRFLGILQRIKSA
jgi:hypothetical protein